MSRVFGNGASGLPFRVGENHEPTLSVSAFSLYGLGREIGAWQLRFGKAQSETCLRFTPSRPPQATEIGERLFRVLSVRCMSVLTMARRWLFRFCVVAIHSAIVLVLYVAWRTSLSDPERDMGWLLLTFIDFPSFFAYIPLVERASGEMVALTSIIVGGAQWSLIGVGIDLVRRQLWREESLRGASNI